LPNTGSGIVIGGNPYVTVGGTTAAAANVISGNGIDGIELHLPANIADLIEGNDIGTDASGTIKLGNASDGIYINENQVTIGGTVQGAGNVIADNGNAGIEISASNQQGTFLSNSIFGNANGGISFANAYPTPNHLNEQGIPSPAPNDFQNYPVLSSATTNGTTTEVLGSLNAAANTQYLVQFFASPQADPTGYGQGQVYLGSEMSTTGTGGDDANNVAFQLTLPTSLTPGWFVSATATDPIGNTSEFSQDVPVQAIGNVAVTISSSPASTVYVDAPLTYTVTVSENGPAAANGVVLTDTLPQQVTNVTATTSVAGVNPTISGGVVTADLGFMAVGTTATLTIVVGPTTAAVPQIVDLASVTSLDIDPDPSNGNFSLETAVVPVAALALTLEGSPAAVTFGDSVTYTLAATNYGPSVATGVVVTDTLPQNRADSFTFGSSDQGITFGYSLGQFTASIATLAVGATSTFTITVQTNIASVPQIVDSATITSNTYDPKAASNTPAPVTTAVAYQELEVGVDWTGPANAITSLILYFDDPLIASTATNPNNYTLVNLGHNEIFGSKDNQNVSLLTPVYNPANWTVTLTPVTPLARNQFYHLLVNGTSPSGVTNLGGNLLAGAGPGQPGTNYTALLAQGTKFFYYDTQGDKVTMSIQKGGYLKDLLSASGEGARLVVVGERPRHTVLTGKVAKAKHHRGTPTLGYTIYGLGQFGDVLVNMTDPPFLVSRFPFSPGPPIPQPSAALARVGGTDARPPAAAASDQTPASSKSLARVSLRPSTSRVLARGPQIGVPPFARRPMREIHR
jgi:uncharacterized repeat protein (TIGR01451 family)